MNIAGYVRQAPGHTDPDSAFAQSERVRRWVRDAGHELIVVCQDHRAASTASNRPGLRALLDIVRAGRVDAVVVGNLAALSPDVVTQEIIIVDIKEAGATVIATDEHDLEALRDAADDHTRMIVRDIVAKVHQYQGAYGLSNDAVPTVEPAPVESLDPTDLAQELDDPTDVVIQLHATP